MAGPNTVTLDPNWQLDIAIINMQRIEIHPHGAFQFRATPRDTDTGHWQDGGRVINVLQPRE